MIAYCGQTREAGLVAELAALGIGECTQRGELPPRREPWFHDCRTFADWRAARAFDGVRWGRDQRRIAHGCAAWQGGWRKLRHGPLRPDFVVVPDIPAGGEASLALSARERPYVAEGCPAYLVVQDGMMPDGVAMWLDEQPDPYHGLFVGGTLAWKLGTAAAWVDLAHTLGLRCHIGRVGPPDRVRWARDIGADSIDSSLPLRDRRKLEAFLSALGYVGTGKHKPATRTVT